MKEIQLTQGKVALIDDADFDLVSRFKWYAVKMVQKGSGRVRFYAHAKDRSKDRNAANILMHRVLAGARPNEDVDHWDGDGLNNQRDNLRIATAGQNAANKKPAMGISGRKGVAVTRKAGTFQATIEYKQIGYYLGTFKDKDIAARAYDVMAQRLFGEFAATNFPFAELPGC